MSGVLEGVKVVDMTVAIAMPAATAMMADWGADVIKIEPITVTGEQRVQDKPPPWGMRETGGIGYMTMEMVNRGKKSLAIDLKKKEGVEILHKLVKTADVFASNYEYSTVKRFQADYDSLSKINPGIVYCVLTAYGRSGPDKDLRGGDFTASWARGGSMYMVGEAGSPPAMNLWGALDRTTGAYCCAGIAAALWHKEKTGKGQQIDVSLYQSGVWFDGGDIQMALLGMEPPKYKHTEGVTFNPMWNCYRTKDGRHFQMQPFGFDWPGLCKAMERPDLLNDPRCTGGFELMRKHAEEIIAILDKEFAKRTMADWEKRFRENNIIHGRVATPMEVVKDPQALANNFFAEVEHQQLGKIKLVATPVKFHENPAEVKGPAPQRGGDTEVVLMELGYEWEQIAKFKEQQVIL